MPLVLRCFDVAVVTLVVVSSCVIYFLISIILSLLFLIVAPSFEYFGMLITLGDRTLFWGSIISSLSFSLVSHVPVLLFPVSSDLLLFHPVVVPFFLFRSMPSTCVVRSFRRPFGTFLLSQKRLSFRWFLICSWKLFAIAMALFLLCYWARASLRLYRLFVSWFRYC